MEGERRERREEKRREKKGQRATVRETLSGGRETKKMDHR